MEGQFDVSKVLASILGKKGLHDGDVKPVVNAIGELAEAGHFDVERGLRELKGRIRRRRIVRTCSAVAAMAVLLVGTTLLYRNAERVAVPEPVVVAVVEEPEEVVLIVPGKDKISLPDSGRTVFRRGQGMAVEGKGNACLSFKEKEGKMDRDTLPEEPEYNVLRIPRKKNYTLELADGSRVYLNAETELLFPSRFTGKERKVVLSYGEAYFEVARNSSQPFKVETGKAELQVLGTSFNVNSYTPQVVTTLVEGSLKVKSAQAEVVLKPGEQAGTEGEGIEVREVELPLYTAWKDGMFVFRRLELESILQIMQRWYDFEYFFKDDALRGKIFTGAIDRNKDKEQAFQAICKAIGIKITVNGNQVVLE